MENNKFISQCIVLLILYRSLPINCAPTEKPPKYGMYDLLCLHFDNVISELLVKVVILSMRNNETYAAADPGFSQGGANSPRWGGGGGGGATYDFAKFS